MGNTKIEYLDYCWNFYTGCLNGCSYCWAHKRANRFNKGDFTPKLHPEMLFDPFKLKKPSRIGVCFTGDLFGDWVDPDMKINCNLEYNDSKRNKLWTQNDPRATLKPLVIATMKQCPEHTFIILTKQPQNLTKWQFPDNCHIGVSVCNDKMLDVAVDKLEDLPDKHKFISFEPLLERLTLSLDYAFYYSGISWAIIGQQTPVSKKTASKVEWIREIVKAADKASIPVFLKNNLRTILPEEQPFYSVCDEEPSLTPRLRQEFPIC